MTDEDLAAEKDRRIGQLEAENLRLRLSGETGVPASLLGDASTEADIRAAANAALAWKAATAAPPPSRPQTAALPASVVTSADRVEMPRQVQTLGELRRLPPAERMPAYREGRLMHLGANRPAHA
jgi:hypothetical protein